MKHFGATPLRVQSQDLDGVESVFPCTVNSISDRIVDILPRRETWSSDLVQFGTEDGTRVDLWTADTRIEEMSVRIDANELNSTFLIRLAEIGKEFDLLFVSENAEVIPPSARRLFRALASSNASRFIEDPEAFLANLPPDEHG